VHREPRAEGPPGRAALGRGGNPDAAA